MTRGLSQDEQSIGPLGLVGGSGLPFASYRWVVHADACPSLRMRGRHQMLTTVVGSWPAPPHLLEPLAQFHRGELGGEAAEELLIETARVAIHEQRDCGLDEWTGGETWCDTLILHLPRRLTGIEIADPDGWGGRGTYRVIGPLGAPQGLGYAEAFRRERRIDPTLTKATVPGPSEVTMMLGEPELRRGLRPVAIELVRREIADLVEAGATDIQLDLPHVAMGLADGGWTVIEAVNLVRRAFEGLAVARRSVHFLLWGFPSSFVDAESPASAGCRGASESGWADRRAVVELSLPEQWEEYHLLAAVPTSIEIAAGIVDVKAQQVQAAAEIAARLHEVREALPNHRLLVCPSCGLGRREHDLVVRKCREMVAAAKASV